jgi:ABC-type polysaccharide/polyol phosphate transport system ATPase subunit
VAVKRVVAPSGPGGSTENRDAVIVAEGISKRYPLEPVRLFPPVVMFHRRSWFPLRRSAGAEEPDSAAKASSEQDPAADRARVRARRRKRERDYEDLEDDDDDLDDDDDDDDDDEEEMAPGRVGGPTPMQPGEMFWALRDVSFSLRAGAALGVLGGPGAGKTTLLNILGGRVFPTEGQVVTRGTISPMPGDLAKGITLSGKGFFPMDLVMGCRLLGLHSHVVKPHREEIEELAQPVLDPDGDPAPGAATRLAVATAVTLPADAILIEDGLRGMDEAFTARIVERLQNRLRDGTAVVLSSRRPEVLGALCDEIIVLEQGAVARRGPVSDGIDGHEAVRDRDGDAPAKRQRARSPAARGTRSLRPAASASTAPSVPAPFHESAALISVELQAADGSRSKRVDATDELSVSIRLETVLPDTEVRCGVCFTPRSGDTGVRVEHPEPLRLSDPRAYVVQVRVPAGTLPAGSYQVHADAVIATGAERDSNAIRRDAGRLRIVGEHPNAAPPQAAPVEHWDGCVSWRADADWSLE